MIVKIAFLELGGQENLLGTWNTDLEENIIKA